MKFWPWIWRIKLNNHSFFQRKLLNIVQESLEALCRSGWQHHYFFVPFFYFSREVCLILAVLEIVLGHKFGDHPACHWHAEIKGVHQWSLKHYCSLIMFILSLLMCRWVFFFFFAIVQMSLKPHIRMSRETIRKCEIPCK